MAPWHLGVLSEVAGNSPLYQRPDYNIHIGLWDLGNQANREGQGCRDDLVDHERQLALGVLDQEVLGVLQNNKIVMGYSWMAT